MPTGYFRLSQGTHGHDFIIHGSESLRSGLQQLLQQRFIRDLLQGHPGTGGGIGGAFRRQRGIHGDQFASVVHVRRGLVRGQAQLQVILIVEKDSKKILRLLLINIILRIYIHLGFIILKRKKKNGLIGLSIFI